MKEHLYNFYRVYNPFKHVLYKTHFLKDFTVVIKLNLELSKGVQRPWMIFLS